MDRSVGEGGCWLGLFQPVLVAVACVILRSVQNLNVVRSRRVFVWSHGPGVC